MMAMHRVLTDRAIVLGKESREGASGVVGYDYSLPSYELIREVSKRKSFFFKEV